MKRKWSENKTPNKVNWSSCSASEFSNCHVYGLVLDHPAFIFEKENRREPFTLHFSFKSTFTAPSTFPTFGRSVGQLALTTHLLSNHERCISRQNDEDAFTTTTTLGEEKEELFRIRIHQRRSFFPLILEKKSRSISSLYFRTSRRRRRTTFILSLILINSASNRDDIRTCARARGHARKYVFTAPSTY